MRADGDRVVTHDGGAVGGTVSLHISGSADSSASRNLPLPSVLQTPGGKVRDRVASLQAGL